MLNEETIKWMAEEKIMAARPPLERKVDEQVKIWKRVIQPERKAITDFCSGKMTETYFISVLCNLNGQRELLGLSFRPVIGKDALYYQKQPHKPKVGFSISTWWKYERWMNFLREYKENDR
jgi:hypothetical protein